MAGTGSWGCRARGAVVPVVHGDPGAWLRLGAAVSDLRVEHVRTTRDPVSGLMCLRRRGIEGLYLCALPRPWLPTAYRLERDGPASTCLRCVALLFGGGR